MTIGMLTVATLRPRRVAALTFAPTVVATAAYLAGAGLPIWSSPTLPTVLLLVARGLGDSSRRWALRTEQLAARAAQAVADERVPVG